MKRTTFEHWQCSIAQTVEVIGDAWSLLILRNVFWGVHRFDELLTDLSIARNILSDRLRTLVEHGVLEKVAYQDTPVRYEYRLTEKGRALWPVLLTMAQWGDRWTLEDTTPITFTHTTCGHEFHAQLACDHCNEPLAGRDVRFNLKVSREAASGRAAS